MYASMHAVHDLESGQKSPQHVICLISRCSTFLNRVMETDVLSALPMDVILDIVLFLEYRDVVRLSMVSSARIVRDRQLT